MVYCFTKSNYYDNFEADQKPSTKFKNEKASFKVLLIGLDGGTKLELTNYLSTEKLFTIIEGVPMRKRKLKIQKQ